jgi:hypothetical protein
MSDLLTRERSILTALGAPQQNDLAGLLRILLAPFDAAGLDPAGGDPAGGDPAGLDAS